eukprot:scaffold478_cov409-Prasinococcus_capsulatus_cf.AAC.5
MSSGSRTLVYQWLLLNRQRRPAKRAPKPKVEQIPGPVVALHPVPTEPSSCIPFQESPKVAAGWRRGSPWGLVRYVSER